MRFAWKPLALSLGFLVSTTLSVHADETADVATMHPSYSPHFDGSGGIIVDQVPGVVAMGLIGDAPGPIGSDDLTTALKKAWHATPCTESTPGDYICFQTADGFAVVYNSHCFVIYKYDCYLKTFDEAMADVQNKEPAKVAGRTPNSSIITVELRSPVSEEDKNQVYRDIGHLIAALADDMATSVVLPETGSATFWNDAIRDKLCSDDPRSAFGLEQAPHEDSKTTPTPSADPTPPSNPDKFDAATREAQATLGGFIDTFHRRPENANGFAVEFNLVSADHTEAVWLLVTQIDNGTIRGTLFTPPKFSTEFKKGDAMKLGAGYVIDWSYWLNHQQLGNYRQKAEAQ